MSTCYHDCDVLPYFSEDVTHTSNEVTATTDSLGQHIVDKAQYDLDDHSLIQTPDVNIPSRVLPSHRQVLILSYYN